MLKIKIEIDDGEGHYDTCEVTCDMVTTWTPLTESEFVQTIRSAIRGIGYSDTVIDKVIISEGE